MSFLREVLSSAEEADIHTLKKKLPIISTQISSCKQEVVKLMEDVYYKFNDWPKHNQKLLDVSSQLSSELCGLQRKVEQITIKEIDKNNTEVKNLSEELDLSNIKLTFVMCIIQIHETLLTVRQLSHDRLFIKAAYMLIDLKELIDKIPENEVTEVVSILKNNVMLETTAVLGSLCEMFNDVIQVQMKVSNNVTTCTIGITKRTESITQLFEVLFLLNGYAQTIDRVFKFILEVCRLVILNITTVKLQDEDTHNVLVIAIKNTVVKCEYTEVFSKLTEIFAFLYSYFDYMTGNGETSMRYFGSSSGLEFTKMLLDNCLERMKPTNEFEYTRHEMIINDIVKFQEKLVEFNIFGNDNAILEYAKNLDEILIEQKCNMYLANAITLMKKDLHESHEVGVANDDGNLLAPEQFPQSIISQSVTDILDLVQTLLAEALEVSDRYAARLICTAQSIFYQYGNIVHGCHERLLATIPQQVALFRNNCLYVAHALVQINLEYHQRFATTVLPSEPLFPDQGQQLKTIGGEIFLGYIDEQVRLMEGLLEQHLPPEQIADELNPDIEKLIRQSLRQYELLKTVWIKILPQSVYNKSIGYLFNAFCKKLIVAVMNAPDIPTKNAEQLIEAYKVVIARGPKLFSNSQEISLYVDAWAKLNDLVFILGANLVNISDMWADGKGVLTLTFPAEELRSLIKALFQNTDRRAAVLSRIH